MTRFYVFFLSLFSLGAFASIDTLVFNNNDESSLIGKHIYIYKDETGELDFESIKNRNDFVRSGHDIPNLGVSPYTFWLKFSVTNKTNEDALLLELSQPSINQVILYGFNEQKADTQIMGDNYPFDFRKYKHPSFVFVLDIKSGQTKSFLMKVKSDEQILLPLKIGVRSEIVQEMHNRDIFFGIYAGIMIVMIFYNLFIFFFARDKIYLYYVIYVVFIFLTQASILGYLYEFLWAGSPYFANISIDIFSCCVGISAIEFLKAFLHTKEHAPKLHRFSYIISGLYVISFIIPFLGYMNAAYYAIQINAVIVALYMLIVAIIILNRGVKPALFFLIAWSAMLVGIIIFVMKDFGFLPSSPLTNYTMPIGSALETILLAIALADKINNLQKEKEESQAEALRISEENHQLVAQQNVMLEQKVHERTEELENANDNLETTLKYLKDTQSQLVDNEKMASLGLLTAGIAHEINNPINFVSANIKPLKMDIQDLLEVMNKYEELSANEDIKGKLKEIEELKKQIDLDYTKKEIDILLNSVEDGAKRTAEIVAGLKTFSRLEEGGMKTVNINEGIESTLVLLRGTVPHNVSIEKALEPLPPVDCYPGKLNQVFMNIISNAIYAVNKKGEGWVRISSYHKLNHVYVVFEDSGIGMSAETKEKIFEPFYTTKPIGEGTGLGMSIVFKIIETHGAKLQIESELGVGTKITLILNKTLARK